MFSWVAVVRVLSLAGSHSPPYLPRMPSNTVLISGPAVGAAQILIWSYSSGFLLQCSQLSERESFLLWELSMTFYIFHSHRVCLVDRVDLICRLYCWWEGFGSSSLVTLPRVWFVVLFTLLHMRSSTGVFSWGCPGGLGFAPVRARCRGNTAAWVTGVLAVPGT